MSDLEASTFAFKTVPPPRVEVCWGILNQHDEFWTPTTFDSADEAHAHVVKTWKNTHPDYIGNYRYVMVTKTIAVKPEPVQAVRVSVTKLRQKAVEHG
jgi:hypothetical protein